VLKELLSKAQTVRERNPLRWNKLPEGEWLQQKEAAALTGLRIETLKQYVWKGRCLPPQVEVRRIGRTVLLRRVGEVITAPPLKEGSESPLCASDSREAGQDGPDRAEVILIY
jgi:hypothetical protein